MVPVEWPIAARSDDRGADFARRAEGDRLSAVRADFFLDPEARLTEQERSLMTFMLADLVVTVADEIRAAAQLRTAAANDDGADLVQRLTKSALLDIAPLIALLLRRAEQERVASLLRAGSSGANTRFLHGLAADRDSAVAAAAMALILARSRRRDRFDSARIVLDDVPADAACRLVYVIGAALSAEASSSGAEADRRLADAAASVLAGHDEGKRLDALAFNLIHALDRSGRLDEEMLRAALADGEVALVCEGLCRRAGLDFETAWPAFASAGPRLGKHLRLAGASRPFAAEVAAALGGSSPARPAEAISAFDALSDADVEQARSWLRIDNSYREALAALGGADGDPLE